MKKSVWAVFGAIALCLAACVLMGGACTIKTPDVDMDMEALGRSDSLQYEENERLCRDFVESRLSSESGGIYTNYIDSYRMLETAAGHQILSESEGLAMLYYVSLEEREKFDIHLELIKDRFITDKGTVRWRTAKDGGSIGDSSASIDELRIARALMYAYQIWHDPKYIECAQSISRAVLRRSTYKGCLVNHYDPGEKVKAEVIDLSYLDIFTMEMSNENGMGRWKPVVEKGIDIVEEGYIGDYFPFYRKSYDIGTGTYDNSLAVNMIDSLLTVLHLSEVGMQRDESIGWIRDRLDEGAVYSSYYVKNGNPAGSMESTAVYAIIARIAKNISDEELHEKAVERMVKLQVMDAQSEIYGAFGDRETLEVYSFDNLQALLGF